MHGKNDFAEISKNI